MRRFERGFHELVVKLADRHIPRPLAVQRATVYRICIEAEALAKLTQHLALCWMARRHVLLVEAAGADTHVPSGVKGGGVKGGAEGRRHEQRGVAASSEKRRRCDRDERVR